MVKTQGMWGEETVVFVEKDPKNEYRVIANSQEEGFVLARVQKDLSYANSWFYFLTYTDVWVQKTNQNQTILLRNFVSIEEVIDFLSRD
jgi:hypothetical protein